MPLNSAMAQNVLRQASSASLNSERVRTGARVGVLDIANQLPVARKRRQYTTNCWLEPVIRAKK